MAQTNSDLACHTNFLIIENLLFKVGIEKVTIGWGELFPTTTALSNRAITAQTIQSGITHGLAVARQISIAGHQFCFRYYLIHTAALARCPKTIEVTWNRFNGFLYHQAEAA